MSIKVAFIKKEFLQIWRDPSSLIIAFILPTILLFIYAFAINMDSLKVNLGIKNDDNSAEVVNLVKSFSQNPYIKVQDFYSQQEMEQALVQGKINAALFIPQNFSQKLAAQSSTQLLLLCDGAFYNQVGFAQQYVSSIVENWFKESKFYPNLQVVSVEIVPRVWFNQNNVGQWAVVPASLAITMTLIGILLTALVISREWERGTLEALLATNIRTIDILVGKYVPYFVVGMASLLFNVGWMIFVFQVPFRGSVLVLIMVSSLFLFACLGVGLIISSLCRNQFLASITSLIVGFLPALMLAGVVFPVSSMPKGFQWVTWLLPPKHYVDFIRSEFLVGTVMVNVVESSMFLLALGIMFAFVVYLKIPRRLDD